MRKNASQTAAKRYPELHRYPNSPNWIFRKYSKEKRAEFFKSTGVPATEADAAFAYKRGREMFDAWLGTFLPSGRTILVRDLARAVLASKAGKKRNTQRTVRNQMERHVIPAFGHLRPDQITPLRWQQYDADERKKGKRKKLFNTRKALNEILNRAVEEGLIKRAPELKNFDPPAAPPKYIPAHTFVRIHDALSPAISTLAFIMYHQGARPMEVLQYRHSMIDWKERTISIPGEITKTGRPRTIPLNSLVAERLKAERLVSPSDFIFPMAGNPSRPMTSWNAVWDRAMEKLGLDYSIYNLRDTHITNQLKRGFSSTFIGKYCDTSAEMIEKKYAVAEQDIMRKLAG